MPVREDQSPRGIMGDVEMHGCMDSAGRGHMRKRNGWQDWAKPGAVTEMVLDPASLENIPSNYGKLALLVQGLMLNLFWAEEQGVEISEERLDEVELRTAKKMLDGIIELDNRPLDTQRKAGKRLVANARDFAVLYTSLLRAKGRAARVRCGFSAYFRPGLYLEHWLVEAWLDEEKRWVLVDPQLDQVQREALGIGFPACDVPRDQFLIGGQAWQMCRAGEEDPDIFGLYGYTGMWFIRGSLIRDVLALAKIEVLPWDSFGLIAKEEEALTEDDLVLLDELAELTTGEEVDFHEVLSLVQMNEELQPPLDITQH